MTLQAVFGVLVIFCSVANLASMGLELDLRETIKSLRSARLVMILLAGPAPAIVALPLARFFAFRADGNVDGGLA